jgi:hypothetical protein
MMIFIMEKILVQEKMMATNFKLRIAPFEVKHPDLIFEIVAWEGPEPRGRLKWKPFHAILILGGKFFEVER